MQLRLKHNYTFGKVRLKSVKSENPCKSLIQTSYDIVKAHGGEIRVETKPGKGSLFYHSITRGLNHRLNGLMAELGLFRKIET